jgi:hypothetical protein
MSSGGQPPVSPDRFQNPPRFWMQAKPFQADDAFYKVEPHKLRVDGLVYLIKIGGFVIIYTSSRLIGLSVVTQKKTTIFTSTPYPALMAAIFLC